MKYDMSQIENRVNEKKRKFKIAVTLIAIALITAMLSIITSYGKSDEVVFWSAIAFLILLLITRSVIIKYSPTVLFSPEIRGINILEDAYALLANKRGFKMGSRTSVYAHHAGKHQLVGKERIRAAVYLKLENGDVRLIDNLSVAHTELYEEGDELYKAAGVKYPIILSRESKKQPCPLCGRINTDTDTQCSSCGVNIYK